MSSLEHIVNRQHEVYAPEAKAGGEQNFGETTGKRYRLSEIARETGLNPQYIIHLISRYKIVQPDRLEGIYQFTSEDLAILQQVQDLRRRGQPLRMIAHELENEKRYQHIAQELSGALDDYAKQGDSQSWSSVVHALSEVPTLDAKESQALRSIEGNGKTFGETVSDLGVRSEREVKDVLEAAHMKVGGAIFGLLRRFSQK